MTAGHRCLVDEFELIGRCFRDRATRRPDTVLGIGDDSALLDAGGRPLVRAWATVPFSSVDDGTGTARYAFTAAFIRLAARAATPRWATLALTLEAEADALLEPFAVAAAAVCDACGVELIGGDTTRGPGRATVFASGTGGAHPRRGAAPPAAAAAVARIALSTPDAPDRDIADLVAACTELAAAGAAILCEGGPGGDESAGSRSLELVVRTDDAGMDGMFEAARRLSLDVRRLEPDG